MNLSSRWCVTAVVALGALSCSDPVPPPAQGAFIVSLAPNGKTCPSGSAFTYDVPEIRDTKPTEQLSEEKYLHWVIDGESDSSVSCKVHGSSSFTFSGRIKYGVKVLELADGTLVDNMKGTARVTVANLSKLSNALSSPAADCTVNVVNNSQGNQVKAGSIWATFSCPSVDHEPQESCSAKGTFVLENCTQ